MHFEKKHSSYLWLHWYLLTSWGQMHRSRRQQLCQKLFKEFAQTRLRNASKLQKDFPFPLFNFYKVLSKILRHTEKILKLHKKKEINELWGKVKVSLTAAKWHLQSFVLMKLGGNRPKRVSNKTYFCQLSELVWSWQMPKKILKNIWHSWFAMGWCSKGPSQSRNGKIYWSKL